ncbi:MAG: hypothetical protein BMS9Abin37_2623 [Acidobacteriota bacterium]|nr:MAG: hypothetical protein BMS9Abin37_2623 [Acidobacteriota bacterium]
MTRRHAEHNELQFPINLPQTPGEYLDILRFRWYWIVIGLVLGAVGSQIVVRFVPERYVSRTVVLVEGDTIPDRFIPRMSTAHARDRLRTINEEILARPRIERILDDLNPYPELTDQPRAEIVDMIRSRAGIGLRGKEAFVVEYTDTDPQRAQQMASRLASLFIEQTSGDRAAQALDANQFIQTQLEETKRDLESVEARLGAVKTRNMGMLPRQLDANLATLQRFELQRQSIEVQIRSAMDRRTLIERQLTLQRQMNEPEAQLVPTIPSAGMQTAVEPSNLSQLKQYLAVLRTRYTDEHPEVQTTLARIARLEREKPIAEPPAPDVFAGSEPLSLDGDLADQPPEAPTDVAEPNTFSTDIMVTDLRAQLAAANQDIRAMQADSSRIRQKIAEYQARVEKIPEVEQELQSLERDYSLISKYYSELLSRKLEAETAGAVEREWQEQFSIIDPAQVPESASFPSASLFLLAGTAMGLGAGVLGAFLLEVLDPSVKSLRELEALLPYPVLLTVPQIKVSRRHREARREPTPPAPPSESAAPEKKLSAVS